jgi:hypothetical protein
VVTKGDLYRTLSKTFRTKLQDIISHDEDYATFLAELCYQLEQIDTTFDATTFLLASGVDQSIADEYGE